MSVEAILSVREIYTTKQATTSTDYRVPEQILAGPSALQTSRALENSTVPDTIQHHWAIPIQVESTHPATHLP